MSYVVLCRTYFARVFREHIFVTFRQRARTNKDTKYGGPLFCLTPSPSAGARASAEGPAGMALANLNLARQRLAIQTIRNVRNCISKMKKVYILFFGLSCPVGR